MEEDIAGRVQMIRCSPHNLNVLGYCELKIRYLTTNLPYILGSGQFQRILKFSGGGGGGGGGIKISLNRQYRTYWFILEFKELKHTEQ